MAQAGFTPISLYYSSTPSAVPTNTNLVAGELALNIADGKLYYKDGSNIVKLLASTAGASGDVVGPASATADSLVAFDGTTGKLIKQVTTGTGVVTAVGNSVNTANGIVTQSATLTASALLVGGGSGTAISSTTTGTGVVTAIGNNVNAAGGLVTTDGTATLTNKRINPRAIVAGVTSGNLTINGDTTDLYEAEGLTGAITFLQPSGTPVDGQKLMIRIKDDGTARGISWTTSVGAFRAVGITLPTTTVINKVTYVGCVYNSTDSFWDAVATVTQA